jgi:hypothetical protein
MPLKTLIAGQHMDDTTSYTAHSRFSATRAAGVERAASSIQIEHTPT